MRNAVLLVAGDKSGRWREWYAEAIPAARKLQVAAQYLTDIGSPQKASSNVLANIVLEPMSIDFTKWLVRPTTPGRAR